MSTRPSNPNAFPVAGFAKIEGGKEFHLVQSGMTLRDYFAAQAMSGMCANPMALNRQNMAGALERLARDAYALSDAMLNAREA